MYLAYFSVSIVHNNYGVEVSPSFIRAAIFEALNEFLK